MKAPKLSTFVLVGLATLFVCSDGFSQKKRFPFRRAAANQPVNSLELSIDDGALADHVCFVRR